MAGGTCMLKVCSEVTRCGDEACAVFAGHVLQAANAKHALWRELCDASAREFAQTPRILGTDNQTVLALTGVSTRWWQYVATRARNEPGKSGNPSSL